MSLCTQLKINPDEWIANQNITPIHLLWLCAWVAVPVSIGIVETKRIFDSKDFCPIIAIEVFVFMLTYCIQIEANHVMALVPAVFVALLTECFSLLNYVKKIDSMSRFGLLVRFAMNRKFFVLLYFWSVVFPSAVGVAWRYHSIWFEIPPASLLIPVPFVLMFLPYQQFSEDGIPLNIAGLIGTVVLWGISFILSSLMWKWKEIALAYIGVGYFMLFLVESSLAFGYWIDTHRKNPKK